MRLDGVINSPDSRQGIGSIAHGYLTGNHNNMGAVGYELKRPAANAVVRHSLAPLGQDPLDNAPAMRRGKSRWPESAVRCSWCWHVGQKSDESLCHRRMRKNRVA